MIRLVENTVIISSDTEIAETLNSYFSSIIKALDVKAT